MLDALTEHMPEGVHWTKPMGGLFLWVRTPLDTKEFFPKATEEKVAYVPGFAFYPGEEGGQHSMRMNFSNAPPERINEGIYRLSTAMKKELASG